MLDILRNKTFLLFFLGNIISLIGFGFNLIAFSWLVLEETGSEFALGKIMAAATTPGLILALFAGVIIDKVNQFDAMRSKHNIFYENDFSQYYDLLYSKKTIFEYYSK